MIAFARSTDYALIQEILTDPQCYRRMTHRLDLGALKVGPAPGIDYILASDNFSPVAVFLIVHSAEVHFCFVPARWGRKRTEPIAHAFLTWVWGNTRINMLLGHVPAHNRLALRLAKAVGFIEYGTRPGIILTKIERPK